MPNADTPSQRGAFPGLALILFGALVALLWMAMTMPIPAQSVVAADPLSTDTPTPTVAPDCRLGYIGPQDWSTPEMTVRAFRAGIYYGYTRQVYVTLDASHGAIISIPEISSTREVKGAQHILLVRVHSRMFTPTPLPGSTATPTWDPNISTPAATVLTPSSYYYWNASYAVPTPGPTPLPGTPRSWEFGKGGIWATAQAQAIADTGDNYKGALWLIGNEIDKADDITPPDYPTPPPPAPTYGPGTGRQDGIAPEAYAEAYHDIYLLIKSHDPTALVAPGSVVQWTPMREEYWNRVLRAYQDMYHVKMPVDWWNVHAYNRTEFYWYPGCPHVPGQCEGFNESIPFGFTGPGTVPAPGTPSPMPTPTLGTAYPEMLYDAARFEQQLINMRKWLKANGYQDKPLILSEWGLSRVDGIDDTRAQEFFFTQIMPWIMSYTDPAIGYPYDGYHLVQRSVVFSTAQQDQNPNGEYYGFPLWHMVDNNWEITLFGGHWLDPPP